MNIPLSKIRHVCANYKHLWLYAGFEVGYRHRSDAGLELCDYKPYVTYPPTQDWILDKSKIYGGIVRQKGGKYGFGTRLVKR